MADNYQETLTNKAELRCAYSHSAESVNNAGTVQDGHTIEYYDENGDKQKKTGSTISPIYENVKTEWYGRINHVDEVDGGASGQVGFARVDDSVGAFNIVAAEEEDFEIKLKEAVVIETIDWNQRTGQTSVFNAHLLVCQLEVDDVIIEAASHYTVTDGAGLKAVILNSGNGVTVAAGSVLKIATTTGGTLVAGDDVYGIEWIIKYRKA